MSQIAAVSQDQNQNQRDNRKAAWALIAGTAGMIVTMMLHPTGSAIAQSHFMVHLNVGVHSLALLSIPFVFLGALGLTRTLEDGSRWATAAIVIFAMSMLAAMNAAAVSGMVAPWLITGVNEASASESALLHTLSEYTFRINQAFAMIWVVAGSAAILAWSMAMLRPHGSAKFSRGLALYGIIVAPLVIVAVASGHLRLHVHETGLVVLLQAVWLVIGAVQLNRQATAL